MKRDIELIRLLLLGVEYEDGDGPRPDISGFPQDLVCHNCALIVEAGLAHGHIVNDERGLPISASFLRLTWLGHEFVDSCRDTTIWEKAKSSVLKPDAPWTFEVLREYLRWEMRERLHLPHVT